MLALFPQSGDSSGAVLGVRSVALLQVAKLVGRFSYTKGILRVYKRQVHSNMLLSFAKYFSQNWHNSCTYQKKIVPLRRKGQKTYTKTMRTIQLDGEILRNLGIIAEDKMILTKVAKYLRRMAKQASQDNTLMSKEEFFARVEEAEQDIKEGKGITFTNKAEMNAWLNM